MDTRDGELCLVLLDISQTNRPRTIECHWITLTTESEPPPFSNLLSTLIESSIVRRVVPVLGLEQ